MPGRQQHQRLHGWHGPHGPGFGRQGNPWELEDVALEYEPRFSMPSVGRLWLPVILSFLVQVPASVVLWRNRALPMLNEADPVRFGISVVIALIGPLALIAARRFPGPVVSVVTAGALVDIFLGSATLTPPYLALAFAIGSAVNRGARVWAWISVAAAWAVGISVAAVLNLPWQPGRVVATTLGVLIVFGAAEGVRGRRDRLAQFRARALARRQTEVQAERVRIARELHDVLAHSLSQINVQAGVGLHLLDAQPDKAKDALASIKETSKTALEEVRSVLGVLRAEDGADPSAPLVPEPDLARLGGLAASVRSQGVDVVVRDGTRDAPKAVQLALFRIAQESLTNVVRHARASHALIEVSETDGAYAIEITDDGSGGAPSEHGGGRGLLGMRERAELLGGRLEAGPTGHGFRVAAEIPKETPA